MFSPSTENCKIPATRALSRKRNPSGVTWEKNPSLDMFSEWVRAMRQTSESQTNGGRPFFTRMTLVSSKARLSMSFGSTRVAEAGLAVTGAIDVINLATGCGLASCAKADWQKRPKRRAEMANRRDIAANPPSEYQTH